MNLLVLQEEVNKAVSVMEEIYGIHPKDVEVKISSLKPSAGKRGAVSIKSVYAGKESEFGEFRIDPDKALLPVDLVKINKNEAVVNERKVFWK